jgi:hypothetical protein
MSYLTISPLNLNLETSSLPYPPVLEVNGTPYAGAFLQNTFLGLDSGNTAGNLGGNYNTAVGHETLPALTIGNYNTCMGRQAGQGIVSGSENTFIGFINSQISTGSGNTCIGSQSSSSVSGNWNTVIGANIGVYNAAESSNVLLQHPGVLGESNTMHLGSTGSGDRQVNKTFIAGVYGVTTTSAVTSAVLISDGEQLGTIASSIRFKKDVADMGESSSAMMKLRPVTFKYKAHTDDVVQFGLIAEEVQEIMPGIVNLDQEGNPFTVRYHDIVPMLLNELQKLAARVAELEAKV